MPVRRLLRFGVALLLSLCQATATASTGSSLEHGQMLLAAGDYEAAVQVLEGVVERLPASAQALLSLGKAYGRLAQSQPWYRAVVLARRCGSALERAVDLDPDNRDALTALARFYEQAPAVLGGGAEKASALRTRLARLEAQ